MADLDTLRPEVRDAINSTDVAIEMFDTLVTVNRDGYDIIRAELLRLTDENARLRDPEGEWINRGALDHWKDRAERAEAELAAALKANRDCVDHFEQMQAELAALKARLDDAPVTSTGNLHYFEYHVPFIGKHVRLLVEE